MAQTVHLSTPGPATYCRLCLAKDNLRDVFRLEERNRSQTGKTIATLVPGVELVEKIYECTNIKLSPSEDTDCAVCRRCLQAVDIVYHLRMRSNPQANDLIQVSEEIGNPLTAIAAAATSTATINNTGNESPNGKIAASSPVLVPIKEAASSKECARMHRCRYCPKSFRTSTALLEHGKRAHVSHRQHHCTNCLAQFQHGPSLARHMRNRSCFDFTKYRCRVCSESFPDRSQWADHIRIHAKDFPFQCPDCWSQFKYKATLRRHANTVHLLVQC